MKTLAAFTLMLFALSACNTVGGFGRDMKTAGGYLESVGD